jgi:outer membrane receptor for ferrienterochelin and colicin
LRPLPPVARRGTLQPDASRHRAGANKPAPANPTAPDETTDKADANTIVVTGSRIATTVVTAQPITRVTGDDIAKRGFTNLGMALLDQPAFSSPGAGPVGSASGSFGAGQTFANLYDLGSQRTLTLVNGNRFVSPASSSIFGAVAGSPVDLSQIAPALVDRIEVVSVGGAPIYGSDAIAGTVNVILKKNYQGFSVSGSQGISGKGDGHDFNASLLAGKNFADGRATSPSASFTTARMA